MGAAKNAYFQMITPLRVDNVEKLKLLLTTLEGDRVLFPTHWGAARGIREPYDREALLAAVAMAPEEGIVPELRRTSPPAYLAHWYPGEQALSSIHIDSHYPMTEDDFEQFCQAVSRLAGCLEIDFGHIDIRFENQPKETVLKKGSHGHHLGAYWDSGLDALFARNFFGMRLLELMGDGEAAEGAKLLAESGGGVTVLKNGVHQLDLVGHPWTSDPETLKSRQTLIEGRLGPTGIFSQQTGKWGHEAGPRWRAGS